MITNKTILQIDSDSLKSLEEYENAMGIFYGLSKNYPKNHILLTNLAKMEAKCNKQKEAIEAYKMILVAQGEELKREDLTPEQRKAITESMIVVADKIAAKDTEYKAFLTNVIKYGSSAIGGALMLGAIILGVNVKGGKLPTLKK